MYLKQPRFEWREKKGHMYGNWRKKLYNFFMQKVFL